LHEEWQQLWWQQEWQVLQQELQQGVQHSLQQGTCFWTQRHTMRQQVTVSQCGTQQTTVRQAW
jgi:hypothetical protein